MAAATANRSITGPNSGGFEKPKRFDVAASASVRVYAGTLVARDMGTAGRPARPAAANHNHLVHGFASTEVDNSSGAQGAKKVPITVQPGWVKNSSSTDAITNAHIGRHCFVVDDQTVALTDGANARPPAGIILDVDSVLGVLIFPDPTANAVVRQGITDPGAAGAIPVDRSGQVKMVSAGAEARTIAIPTFVGQRIALIADTVAGTITVTAAQAINQTGNTVMTFAQAADFIELVGATVAGALRWRVAANDGVALS